MTSLVAQYYRRFFFRFFVAGPNCSFVSASRAVAPRLIKAHLTITRRPRFKLVTQCGGPDSPALSKMTELGSDSTLFTSLDAVAFHMVTQSDVFSNVQTTST